ncbi:hypothetical protein FQR65_LT17111 [Abscondita terminalis]|nr:hypothetical protein FQR65_LT17111 [Abscondita terminalis]
MADHLSELTSLNRREAKQMVELFFDEISQALIAGEQVKLSGFGNFELRDKRQRPGRNPKTGEEIPISARRVVTFRAGQKFRQRVGTEQEGRLSSVQPNRLRIVSTNALRQAKNGHEFIQKAAEILPKPIEIIAGREEARLIYLGVSHTMVNSGRRLVIDIGGGSTELIIGEEFEPIHTESLQMGCVAFTKAYFPEGDINSKAFEKAVVAARKELSSIANTYKAAGWDTVVGSSGTIKACRQIAVNMGWSDEQENLTREGLEKLKDKLLKFKHISDMEFDGLKEDRRAVLPAGIAILYAVFEVLNIDKLVYSDGALREGVMYDLLGRFQHEDIRDRSVQAMVGRYGADAKQAERVVETAQHLFNGVANTLHLNSDDSI